MSAPAIGGKILDASALDAVIRHWVAALTCGDVARSYGIVLYNSWNSCTAGNTPSSTASHRPATTVVVPPRAWDQ